MRAALAFVFTAAVFGQAVVVERVFPFKNVKTTQQSQELATCVRSIGEIRDISVTDTQVTVKGTPGQVAFVEWALSQLDIPPGPPIHAVSADFPFDGNAQDLVRIFRTAYTPTIPTFQEMATGIRSVNEIRRLYTYNPTGSMIARANRADLDAAGWLFEQLDKPSTEGKQQTFTIAMPANPNRLEMENTIRVFRITQPLDVQEFQSMVTAIRAITEIRRVYSYNLSRSIIAKSSAPFADMATWIVAQLDQPAAAGSTLEYRQPGVDDVVNIYFFPLEQSAAAFNAEVTRIRTGAGIRRAYTFNRLRALLVRGAASEVAKVRELAANSDSKTPLQ